jgi:hypothetical protein
MKFKFSAVSFVQLLALLLPIGILGLLAVAQYGPPPPMPMPPPPSQGAQAGAAVVVLTSALTGSQDVPAPVNTKQNLVGSGTLLFDPSTNKLSFALAYTGLTGPALAAHFHNGAAGVAGPIVQGICGSPDALLGACPSGTSAFITGTWTVPASQVQALLTGQIYVNFHTATNPAGELRGQILQAKNQ